MKVTVIKLVGWLQGRNGTGNVYLLQNETGRQFLGMLQTTESGEKWGLLANSTLQEHIAMGKGALSVAGSYPEEIEGLDGTFAVENPSGWTRLYTGPTQPEPTTPTDADTFEIPFTISFEGKMKLKVAGFEAILAGLFKP